VRRHRCLQVKEAYASLPHHNRGERQDGCQKGLTRTLGERRWRTWGRGSDVKASMSQCTAWPTHDVAMGERKARASGYQRIARLRQDLTDRT
jgi:hypothetical protein